jgi:hypothetical protein
MRELHLRASALRVTLDWSQRLPTERRAAVRIDAPERNPWTVNQGFKSRRGTFKEGCLEGRRTPAALANPLILKF